VIAEAINHKFVEMTDSPVEKYGIFAEFGFQAGITLRSPGENSDGIYNYLENEISPRENALIAPKQVHGSEILFIRDKIQPGRITADGVISINRDYCLTVRTADCLPLLFADADTGIFGAVHIGWRGLAGGIVENLSLILKNLDINLNRLYISLGPAIGSCCYEVGAEIAILFDNGFVSLKNDRYYLDIRGAVMEKLISSGFGENQIRDIAECTSCFMDKYYSFRRDGQARNQMVSYIYKS
jgi:YfiH family protein